MIEFSELLLTRFCHDISGQISAIDNGIEFLKEGNHDIKEKAMEIMSSSSVELVTKIAFYRYAYGSVKHSGEADMEHLSQLIQKFYQNSKVKIIWQYNYGHDTSLRGITNRAGKLLFNLVILVASYLIHGGEIEIKIEKGKGKIIKIIGNIKDAMINPEHAAVLIHNESSEMNVFNIQLYLSKYVANELGAELDIKLDNQYITYSAEFMHQD